MKKTIFTGSSFGSPGIIYSSEGRTGIFRGIHFGFSVIPEHQKDLKAIYEGLGIPYKLIPENFGLKTYSVTKFPKERFFFEKGKTHTCLTFESGVQPLKGWQNEELDNSPEHIATAWDEASFGVVVPNLYFDELNELYKAFERKDIMVHYRLDPTYLGYPHPYLWVGIVSHVEPEEAEKAFQVHKEFYEKNNMVVETV